MTVFSSKDRGTAAEMQARLFLESRGMRFVERNYRCRRGEIDLIMREDDTIVFVEVRLRRNTSFGGAAETVDGRKRNKLTTAAHHYLQRHRVDGPCRFDVVAIDGGGPPHWISNAFDAS